MDHIPNDTSLIGPSDVIPVGAQNPRFPVVGHRILQMDHITNYTSLIGDMI